MTDQAPPPLPPASPDEPRRFVRSREDKIIAGVCGGLARYFRIDPIIVRIAAVALLFVGGITAIAYVAAIVFVPEDGEAGASERSAPSRAATVLGVAVLVIAGFAALDELTFGWGWGWWLGPLVPLAIITALLLTAGRRLLERRGERDVPAARIAGMTLLILGGMILLGTAAVGSAWATAAGGGEIVAGIVIALGVVMALMSFRGTTRWLAAPALAIALPAALVAAADIDLDGGVGERRFHPAQVADLPAGGYKLGVGELEVDLRRLDWPAEAPVRLKVDLGVGHVTVFVPEDVCVRTEADAGVGYVNVLGEDSGGVDLRTSAGTTEPRHQPSLVLDARLGVGAVEVRHRGGRELGDGFRTLTPDLERAGCAGVLDA